MKKCIMVLIASLALAGCVGKIERVEHFTAHNQMMNSRSALQDIPGSSNQTESVSEMGSGGLSVPLVGSPMPEAE